jgi:hypothetical protein
MTYLFLAYEGNYAGKSPVGKWEIFTYDGKVYLANPVTDTVIEYPDLSDL